MPMIIQFRCEVPEIAAYLRAVLLDQCNTWSRLQRLASDPAYATLPFSEADWHTHIDDPAIHWADWDAIYAALGDDGRKIANTMIVGGEAVGILRRTSLHQPVPPEVMLELVEVDHLGGAGYVLDPSPVGGEPMPDLPVEQPPAEQIEIPSVGWMFVEATTAQMAGYDAAARAAGLADDNDQQHRCAASPTTGLPRWAMKRHRLGAELLAIYGGPHWQVSAPAFSGGWATWPNITE